MQKDLIKLQPGDSAIIIKHKKNYTEDFEIEIYHNADSSLTEEDVVFYALLTRGMAYFATNDLHSVLEYGKKSFLVEKITIH